MKMVVKVLAALIIVINTIVAMPNVSNASEVWLWPVEGCYKITSEWGWRTINGVSKHHAGIDISASTGTPVRAVQDGWLFPHDHGCTGSHLQKTCTKSNCTAGAEGNWIMIRHDTTNNLYTAYKHLSKLKITKEGRVYKGDIIGYVGNTGDSYGSHLHFEMGPEAYYKNTINPLKNNYAIVDKNNPNPGNTPHTCSGGNFLWYWSAHPHYNCYSCATCGKEWANKNETNYIDSCSECNLPKPPTTSVLSVNKTEFEIGETVKFSAYGEGATGYTIGINKDGTRIHTSDIGASYSKSFNEPGNYTAYVTAWNTAGLKDSSTVYFYVHNSRENADNEENKGNRNNYYTVKYNANGGSGAPNSETVPDYDGANENIKLSTKEPVREGYTFLGWSTNQNSSTERYGAGDRYYISEDTTFYAVWEKKEETNYSCGRNLSWKYNSREKTLEINGYGDMFNYNSKNDVPWYHLCEEVETIVIEDGVTTVGNYAFCDFSELEFIKLPITIASIGSSAFGNCDNIIETYYFGCEDEFDEIDIDFGNSNLCENMEFEYYTVKFLNLKGNNIKSQKVKKYEQAVEPQEPTADGYEFSCWMRSDNFSYNFDTRVTRDIVLKAKWKEVPKGQNNNKIILTIGKKESSVFGETRVNDVAPITRNGRTMLPARFVAEALGATVGWFEEKNLVKISSEEITIEIIIGSPDVWLRKIEDNLAINYTRTLDSCPFIENSRTYLPVRFIAEQLGADVEWDEYNQQVIITKNE